MLRRGDALWDAWITRSGNSADGVLYALPIRDFALDDDGQSLEIIFKIDGVARQVVYRGVHYSAWDPDPRRCNARLGKRPVEPRHRS